jgi:hypothetical protein
VPRTIFSFKSNEGGRAVTSVVVCESHCYTFALLFLVCVFKVQPWFAKY